MKQPVRTLLKAPRPLKQRTPRPRADMRDYGLSVYTPQQAALFEAHLREGKIGMPKGIPKLGPTFVPLTPEHIKGERAWETLEEFADKQEQKRPNVKVHDPRERFKQRQDPWDKYKKSLDPWERRKRPNATKKPIIIKAPVPEKSPPPPEPPKQVSPLPTMYEPPSAHKPSSLFPVSPSRGNIFSRVSLDGTRQALVYVDGCCLGNGIPGAKGGWAVVYGPTPEQSECGVLENGAATNNRAKLTAALAALRLGLWREGSEDGGAKKGVVDEIVLTSDSNFVSKGLTKWMHSWNQHGWRLANGDKVKNPNLWKALIVEIKALADIGVGVKAWKVPGHWNKRADMLAKEVTGLGVHQDWHVDEE